MRLFSCARKIKSRRQNRDSVCLLKVRVHQADVRGDKAVENRKDCPSEEQASRYSYQRRGPEDSDDADYQGAVPEMREQLGFRLAGVDAWRG